MLLLAVAILGTRVAVLAADPPCLAANPTSATVSYGGSIKPVSVQIEKIIPNYCIRFNYGGNGMWTTANADGGLSCKGPAVQIDYNLANSAFNGMLIRQFTPAGCGPTQSPPAGAPPAPSGSVYVFYGKTTDMASVPLTSTSAACYRINYSGNNMWFPKSAYAYRSVFLGNPAGLDYNDRKFSAC